MWLGVAHGLEARVVPQSGIKLEFVNVSGLRGKGAAGWLLAPFRLCRALLQAIAVIRSVRPAVVLGMGGYVSGPGGIAAWLLRRPLVIHEQNAVAGLTNKLLARFATRVLEAFPGSFPACVRARHTGNPVRAEISLLGDESSAKDAAGRALHLLVLGGSQGARRLNEVIPHAVRELQTRIEIDVRHQTGPAHLAQTAELYEQLKLDVTPQAFIEDMRGAYQWADLAVCRSGATTVAELAAAGVPAVLVPFPYAVDDHQTRNAHYLVEAGAAVLTAEDQLEACGFAELLADIMQTGERLHHMARCARSRALPDAARLVAQQCAEVAHA